MSLARFGVRKPVPVNLLMLALIIGGIVAGLSLRREFFPEIDPEQALITLPYPGAQAEDIEKDLAIKVEDALKNVKEVDETRTTISEGGGGITAEFNEGENPDRALDEVQRTIDALLDLPEESETIEVRLFENRLPVIQVVVYGDGLDELTLKQAIRGIQDDLRTLPDMGEVLVTGVRDYEIRVDVNRDALYKHNLSLTQVSDTVRQSMLDLPGGTVKTGTGNVKMRTLGVEERGRAIEEIKISMDSEGGSVRLGDIANVRETFVDEQVNNRFQGEPAAFLTVFKVGDQDIVNMAQMVRAYVAGRNELAIPASLTELALRPDIKTAWNLGRNSPRPLPPGAKLDSFSDLARFVEGRLDLLIRNATYGAVLVFLTLIIALNWRAAFWVGIGLVTAILGTVLLMYTFDVTLNLLTMFGLIIVIGLLVDDAIVVSENIQSRHEKGEPALDAAVNGTNQVSWPVVATVLTSIVAFLPLTFIKGNIGDLLGALPMVVACALTMSLLECIVILPSHMGHSLLKRDATQPGKLTGWLRRFEDGRDNLIKNRITPGYARLLRLAVRYRYISLAAAVAMLCISFGLFMGGFAKWNFLPSEDAETLVVDVRMPIGTPIERTNEIVALIEDAAAAQPEMKNVIAVVGQRSNIETGASDAFAPHISQMFLELKPVEQRDKASPQVIDGIRAALEGKLQGVDRVSFSEITGGPGGPDINLRIRGENQEEINRMAEVIKKELSQFPGVFDVADDNELGQREVRWVPTPSGRALGFTEATIAREMRGYLFGIDAHTFAADREDIDVRVRVDEQTRRSLFSMENIWVVNPQPPNNVVPLTEIATREETASYSTIKRVNGMRAITVTADTATWLSPEDVMKELPLEQWRAQNRQLSIELTGRQEQQSDAFASLPLGAGAAAVLIYVILAWLFSSYWQPIIVMLVIPFGLIGAIWGHFLLGFDITFLSVIGFIALSGIVVNDSLILVQFYNEARSRGSTVYDAIIQAGQARLRAIFLTTATTVLGLLPMLLETSFQARFLIPMAISIAAGLLAATMVVLIVLPCVIMMTEDVGRVIYFLWHGTPRPKLPPKPVPVHAD